MGKRERRSATQVNRIIAGAPADDELGSFAGAARVYTKLANEERWFPSAILRASDGENGDEFGNDVDISGDLAVVSAPFEDSQGLNAGAVYVFRFDGNQWNQEQKLVAADTVAGDLFGASIDIEGEQIFIGAPGKDLLGIDQGTAYIFRYDNGSMTWIEDGQLDPGVGNEGAQFGWSLDIHGDTILVGAPFSDLVADGAGAAFLFRWDTMQWVLEAQITAQDGQVDDAFGFSVAIHNDLAIVGAIGVTEAGPNDWVGAAYIFRQNSGTGVWEEEIKILENDGNPTDDYFGWSVDIKDQVATIGQHSNFLRDVTVYERRGGTNWVPYYWRNDFETNSIAILEDDLIILGGHLARRRRHQSFGRDRLLRRESPSWNLRGTGSRDRLRNSRRYRGLWSHRSRWHSLRMAPSFRHGVQRSKSNRTSHQRRAARTHRSHHRLPSHHPITPGRGPQSRPLERCLGRVSLRAETVRACPSTDFRKRSSGDVLTLR